MSVERPDWHGEKERGADFTVEMLRERLNAAPCDPVTSGDGWLWRKDFRDAAVLIPVVYDAQKGMRVLFTVRAAHLYDHAGQISFPGGRSEESDASACDTALREAHEEIGLEPASVELLGSLSVYTTVTGYRVTPVVGLFDTPLAFRLDPTEVAEVFEVPLSHLLDPANHVRHSVIHQGRSRHYYAVPYGAHYIWGATAGMLMNFYGQLAGGR